MKQASLSRYTRVYELLLDILLSFLHHLHFIPKTIIADTICSRHKFNDRRSTYRNTTRSTNSDHLHNHRSRGLSRQIKMGCFGIFRSKSKDSKDLESPTVNNDNTTEKTKHSRPPKEVPVPSQTPPNSRPIQTTTPRQTTKPPNPSRPSNTGALSAARITTRQTATKDANAAMLAQQTANNNANAAMLAQQTAANNAAFQAANNAAMQANIAATNNAMMAAASASAMASAQACSYTPPPPPPPVFTGC